MKHKGIQYYLYILLAIIIVLMGSFFIFSMGTHQTELNNVDIQSKYHLDSISITSKVIERLKLIKILDSKRKERKTQETQFTELKIDTAFYFLNEQIEGLISLHREYRNPYFDFLVVQLEEAQGEIDKLIRRDTPIDIFKLRRSIEQRLAIVLDQYYRMHVIEEQKFISSVLEKRVERNKKFGAIFSFAFFIGIFITLLTINHINTMYQEQEDLRNTAEKNSKAKSQFLANMSHELRTPLSTIVGMTDVLSRTELTNKQHEIVDTLGIASDNLTQVMNDILDISKIESGQMVIESTNFSYKQLLDDVMALFFLKARSKSIQLSSALSPGFNDRLIGDNQKIKQVLVNLISNAIKFTFSGEVLVYSELRRVDEHEELYVAVKDSGIGIPEVKLPIIFDSFTQVENENSRKYQGTGLGLNIAKGLVHIMQGNIGCKSITGKGSSFYFSIPIEKSGPDELLSQGYVPKKQNDKILEKKLRILSADDNEDNRNLFEAYLDGLGHEIDFAINGDDAFNKFIHGDYDIVFMDIQMPVVDGFEATEKIRIWETHNDKNPAVIVALTASALKQDIEKCLKAGCNKHMGKPYKREAIVRLLNELFT